MTTTNGMNICLPLTPLDFVNQLLLVPMFGLSIWPFVLLGVENYVPMNLLLFALNVLLSITSGAFLLLLL
jgi:hypothetical protein